jgi:hypothetical protein
MYKQPSVVQKPRRQTPCFHRHEGKQERFDGNCYATERFTRLCRTLLHILQTLRQTGPRAPGTSSLGAKECRKLAARLAYTVGRPRGSFSMLRSQYHRLMAAQQALYSTLRPQYGFTTLYYLALRTNERCTNCSLAETSFPVHSLHILFPSA